MHHYTTAVLSIFAGTVVNAQLGSLIPCRNEFNVLDDCHTTNECDDCRILEFQNPFTAGFCNAINEGLCQADGCCDSCTDEFNAYETCLMILNLVVCEINCDNVAVTTAAPSKEDFVEVVEIIETTPTPSATPSMISFEEGGLSDELEERGCFDKFSDFGVCALGEPIQCGLCFINNIPIPGEIGGNIDEFCAVADSSLCGFGSCCEPCNSEFTLFEECFQEVVEDITFGTCQLDCDDNDSEDEVTTVDDCLDSLGAYSSCIANNVIGCALCVIAGLPELPSLPDEGGLDFDEFCDSTRNIICGFGDCCQPCEAEFTALETCLETASSVVTLGQCTIDCNLPTLSPTVLPAENNNEGGGGGGLFDGAVCFSGENQVRVLSTSTTSDDDASTFRITTIAMKDLRIGDMVQSGLPPSSNDSEMKFSRIYSFGHYSPDIKSEYLQIYTTAKNNNNPLEITKDHMVYKKKMGTQSYYYPVPASDVSIGDTVMTSNNADTTDVAMVTKIQTVIRRGAFAPFTESGTIVVSDIVASNYVSLLQTPTSKKSAMISSEMMHWLAHVFQAPHRILSKMTTMDKETYTQDGISNWVYHPLQLAQWYLRQPTIIMGLLAIPLLLLATTFYFAEAAFHIGIENHDWMMLLLGSAAGILIVLSHHYGLSFKMMNSSSIDNNNTKKKLL